MKVKYLASGWEDPEFEQKLQEVIDKTAYEYYDIKISSKGNHCMVIFKSYAK
jgi:putative lipoic acid-binding regulatory protein